MSRGQLRHHSCRRQQMVDALSTAASPSDRLATARVMSEGGNDPKRPRVVLIQGMPVVAHRAQSRDSTVSARRDCAVSSHVAA
eukprot:8887073-Pyramimonas_sp.AAC.1